MASKKYAELAAHGIFFFFFFFVFLGGERERERELMKEFVKSQISVLQLSLSSDPWAVHSFSAFSK